MTLFHLAQLALTVFTAVSLVVLGDTFGKLLTLQGVDPVFIGWTRFLFAALLLLPFSGVTRVEMRKLADWRIIARATLIAGGICFILTALKTEPLANVFGAFFIGPVISYLLAILFLGERSSAARGLFLLIGFIGVMLVVKPGFGATPGLFFALIAGCCYGGYLAMTRAVAGSYRPRFLLISQLLIGSVLLGPLGIATSVPEFSKSTALMLLGSALSSALGNYLLVIANRTAEASLIAPLVYSQLISATVLGFLVFNDLPDVITLTGLALILASGMGSLFLTRVR